MTRMNDVSRYPFEMNEAEFAAFMDAWTSLSVGSRDVKVEDYFMEFIWPGLRPTVRDESPALPLEFFSQVVQFFIELQPVAYAELMNTLGKRFEKTVPNTKERSDLLEFLWATMYWHALKFFRSQ